MLSGKLGKFAGRLNRDEIGYVWREPARKISDLNFPVRSVPRACLFRQPRIEGSRTWQRRYPVSSSVYLRPIVRLFSFIQMSQVPFSALGNPSIQSTFLVTALPEVRR
jgi:hypothetical protein